MKLFVNTESLRNGNAGRGVGQYTRLLLEQIRKHTTITLVDQYDQADVVHYPFFDLFFLTLPLIKRRPTVVTIHDVIPLLYPSEYPRGIRGAIKQCIQTASLASVKAIVTDSDCSTHDVIQLLKQPKNKVRTVYLAPDPLYQPASKKAVDAAKAKYALNRPYFLYVGDINYNKNVPELLLQFSKLPDDYLLVLVTRTLKRDNPAALYLWEIIDRLGIEKRLRIVTDASTNEMCCLYSGAFWYAQPSLYEGFGLPVLEAQACGCPVISTDGGSLKEVVKGSALAFDFFEKSIEVDRSPFILSGFKNGERFSWEKTVKEMKVVYENVA